MMTKEIHRGFTREILDHLKPEGGVGCCEWINVERLHAAGITFEKEDGKK